MNQSIYHFLISQPTQDFIQIPMFIVFDFNAGSRDLDHATAYEAMTASASGSTTCVVRPRRFVLYPYI